MLPWPPYQWSVEVSRPWLSGAGWLTSPGQHSGEPGCPRVAGGTLISCQGAQWNREVTRLNASLYPPNKEVVGGYIGFTPSVRPSVRLSVRPSRLPCPLCNIYSSGWILSILATNDHYYERVCCTQWPLTLTYIFKVIWPWLRNRVRSVASTVLDGFFLCLTQMITIIRGCVACYIFFRIWKFEFLANFWNFSPLSLKKKSTVLDGFFPYLAQMITNMRGCVAYNALWPWPIFSRSFGLDLENRVHSIASTVLDGFFPYLVQMITSMRRCVTCDDL